MADIFSLTFEKRRRKKKSYRSSKSSIWKLKKYSLYSWPLSYTLLQLTKNNNFWHGQ